MSNNETFRTHLMPSCLVPGPVSILESAHEALGDALLALPAPAPIMSCLSPGLTTLPPAGVSTQAPTAPAPTPFGLCDSSSSAEGPGERACRFAMLLLLWSGGVSSFWLVSYLPRQAPSLPPLLFSAPYTSINKYGLALLQLALRCKCRYVCAFQ